MSRVPVSRQAETLTDIERGIVPQQRARAGNIGQRVTDVSGAEISVCGHGRGGFGLVAAHLLPDQGKKFVQGGALPEGHVVDGVASVAFGETGQQIGLHDIVNIAEIPAGLTVAVWRNGSFVESRTRAADGTLGATNSHSIDGRSSAVIILRPCSTAICGSAPFMKASSVCLTIT